MLRKPQTYDHIGGLIRSLALDPIITVSFTDHAHQRMAERAIEYSDVLIVLKSCTVIKESLEKGEWVYNAESKNVDGEILVFAVVPYKEQKKIKVISAWKS